MKFDARLNDQKWLGSKCHRVSLFLTAKALGKGSGEAWQAFEKEHKGKTHYELCVLQGVTPLAEPLAQLDNRKLNPNESTFANILAKELRSFKRDMSTIVRKEVSRQLR